jgi:hypothetical protein
MAGILVRATKMVFYGGMRHRPGKTFTIADEAHFSPDGMEKVEAGARDDAAAAVEASPKQRAAQGGVEAKQKRPGMVTRTGTMEPDPGI